MKQVIVIALLTTVMMNAHANYDYAYQSPSESHKQAENLKRNNDLNNSYNSTTPNTQNSQRDQGYGLTSVE